jgi:hypothetical protein
MSNFFIEMKLSSLTGLPKIDLTDIIAIIMPARIKRIENANNAKRVLPLQAVLILLLKYQRCLLLNRLLQLMQIL